MASHCNGPAAAYVPEKKLNDSTSFGDNTLDSSRNNKTCPDFYGVPPSARSHTVNADDTPKRMSKKYDSLISTPKCDVLSERFRKKQ